MRTVVIPAKEIKVYKFEELSDTAKEKVRISFTEDEIYSIIFQEDIAECLKNNYPNSNLNVEYSLCCCQGDGLNIYGTLDRVDALEIFKNPKIKFKGLKIKPSEKEIKRMKFYLDYMEEIQLQANQRRYSYSYKFRQIEDVEYEVEEIVCNLQCHYNLRQVDAKLISTCLEVIYRHFQELDRELENKGYNFLYEFSDGRIKEECDANDWEYTANGVLYCE